MAEQDLDLTMPTRHGECIEITTARWSQMGIAEVNVHEDGQGGQWMATVITAKQARQLADAFNDLATYWGE